MLSGIKSPDDLQDRDILRSFDATRGAGAQIGEFILKKEKNETPFMFVNRVKGEYRAWYDGKASEERSKARASEASREAHLEQLRASGPGVQQTVRPTQTSLEEVLASQEITLTQEYARLTSDEDRLQDQLTHLTSQIHYLQKELQNVRKFRAELSGSHPSPTAETMGRDLPNEVGLGREGTSGGVGEQGDSEVHDSGGTEAHADDPQSSGDA